MSAEYVPKADCDTKHGELVKLLTDISNRLYKDNGGLSIQTRLDRHSQFIRVMLWVLSVLAVATISNGVVFVFALVKKMIAG